MASIGDDLLGNNIAIVEFFPPLVAEPEDVEAGFVAGDKLIHLFTPNPDANRRCEPMIFSIDLTTRSEGFCFSGAVSRMFSDFANKFLLQTDIA